MDKIDSLNQTADFHRLFNHPILDKPTIPDKKRCALRVELISEELRELKEAIEDNDIVVFKPYVLLKLDTMRSALAFEEEYGELGLYLLYSSKLPFSILP